MHRIFSLAILALGLAVAPAGAQLLPHIVMGTIHNPDGSPPDSGEVAYQSYLTKAPQELSPELVCTKGGGWAVDVVFGIPNSTWSVGDTLVVLFENVADGPFQGETFYLIHETTENSPDSVTTRVVLPVELAAFNARVERGAISEQVVLSWKTMSESNNIGFQIERSADEGEYEKIAFIDGAGSTQAARQFEFIDEEVEVGRYQYRLKQIDLNGASTYSEAIEVEVTPPREFELSQNFPNPFNPKTDIVFRLKEDVRVAIKVYNVLGQEVKILVDRRMEAGTHRLTFDARALPSGMYLYSMKAGDFSQVKKMALLK